MTHENVSRLLTLCILPYYKQFVLERLLQHGLNKTYGRTRKVFPLAGAVSRPLVFRKLVIMDFSGSLVLIFNDSQTLVHTWVKKKFAIPTRDVSVFSYSPSIERMAGFVNMYRFLIFISFTLEIRNKQLSFCMHGPSSSAQMRQW